MIITLKSGTTDKQVEELVSNIKEKELIQYLKERRLYVNEEITETEEM